MFKLLSIAILFLFVNAATLGAQSVQSAQPVPVQGTVEFVYRSPVTLLDPSYKLVGSDSKPNKLEIVGDAVTVENISGRTIRRLYLRFIYAHDVGCCSAEGVVAVDRLSVGESRVLANRGLKMSWFAESNDIALTVMATGAEFEDGSHWAAPRSIKHPLYRDTLSLPESHLIIRQCSWVGSSYRAILEMGHQKVVSYCLGVVKDTPDSFEVRMGKWIDLKETDGPMFTDESASLSPERIFPRETYTAVTRSGRVITNQGGIAIFVAKLKFADGRTWRQDTSRDALLWSN